MSSTSRCRLGGIRPRSGDRREDRPAVQPRRDAGGINHGDQPAVARFQRAATPLLRADVEHAQLGALQRALRPFHLVLIDKIPPQDRPLAEAMLDGEIESAETAQGRTRQGMRRRPPGSTRRAPVPELQAAPVLRHAGAVFQSHTSNAARGAGIRACAGECSRGRERHDPTARSWRFRGVALSLAANGAEFAFAGRPISPGQHQKAGGWPAVLRENRQRGGRGFA